MGTGEMGKAKSSDSHRFFAFVVICMQFSAARAPDWSSPEHQERSNKRARFGDAGCADASSAVTSRSIPLPCAATTETLPDDAPVGTLPDGYSGQPGAVILEDKHDGGVYVDSRSASTLLTTEKVKWKRKESDLMSQIVRLNRCNS